MMPSNDSQVAMTAHTKHAAAALLLPWVGPYGGLPPPANVSPADIEEAICAAIEMKRSEVQIIASNEELPNFTDRKSNRMRTIMAQVLGITGPQAGSA
jgi:hypothetical protein